MNSIKQRKGGITPEPEPYSSNKQDEYTKKQQQQQQRSSSFFSSYCGFRCIISLVLTIIGLVYFVIISSSLSMQSNALLRRSSNHNLNQQQQQQQQQQQRQSMTSNSALETATEKTEQETLPLANIHHSGIPHTTANFNWTTLTGTYTLYDDNHEGQQKILGIIHYPYADLSTLLIEEASSVDYIGRLMTLQFQQQQPFSLLSDTSFHSVISTTASHHQNDDTNNHNNNKVAAAICSSITRKGYKPGSLPNQDRSVIAHLAIYDSNHLTPTPSLLVGIFDGHGTRGHEVSHHCAIAFPNILSRIIRDKQQQQQAGSGVKNNIVTKMTSYIKDALLETFVEVDATEPVKGSAGSTAALLFYPGTGTNVYIANTGDSTIIICAYTKSTNKTNILYQNRKHKPHLLDERRRIESYGGRVMIPPSLLLLDDEEEDPMNVNTNDTSLMMKESSRVIIPGSNGNHLALAMSRSIGDYDGKRVGITAIPEIDVLYVTSHLKQQEQELDTQFFAIAASDGLYDVIPQHIVTSFLSQSLFQPDTNNEEEEEVSVSSSPLVACERLVREASRLWIQAESGMNQYRDDITLSVSIIDVHIGEDDR